MKTINITFQPLCSCESAFSLSQQQMRQSIPCYLYTVHNLLLKIQHTTSMFKLLVPADPNCATPDSEFRPQPSAQTPHTDFSVQGAPPEGYGPVTFLFGSVAQPVPVCVL